MKIYFLKFTELLQRKNEQKNNFIETLFSEEYFRVTKEAVKLFLEGKTRFIGKSFYGWVYSFQPMYKEDKNHLINRLNKCLVKPRR